MTKTRVLMKGTANKFDCFHCKELPNSDLFMGDDGELICEGCAFGIPEPGHIRVIDERMEVYSGDGEWVELAAPLEAQIVSKAMDYIFAYYFDPGPLEDGISYAQDALKELYETMMKYPPFQARLRAWSKTDEQISPGG